MESGEKRGVRRIGHLFDLAEARFDRWVTARDRRASLGGGSGTKERGSQPTPRGGSRARAARGLLRLPGPRLLASLRERLRSGDLGAFAQLAQRIDLALIRRYRRDGRLGGGRGDGVASPITSRRPPSRRGAPLLRGALRHSDRSRARWEQARHDLRRLRRAEDPVRLRAGPGRLASRTRSSPRSSTRICKPVVIQDGFQSASTHDLPLLRESCSARVAPPDPASLVGARLRRDARAALHALRPELDLYLLTERGPKACRGARRRSRSGASSTASRS